jgi:hypothetical protein
VALFCRICSSPVAPGSIFCSQHRAQAALFATAFGPKEGEVTPTPEAAPAPAAVIEDPVDAEELKALHGIIDSALDRMFAAAEAQGIAEYRYPELDVYYVNDQPHARVYFGLRPRNGNAAPGYPLTSPAVKQALSRGGSVYTELVRAFRRRVKALKSGEVQTLAVELQNYADVITLCEHTSKGRVRLLTFAHQGGAFVQREGS